MTINASPVWSNWTGNLVHEPPTNGANYYFRPANLAELKSVVTDAVAKGVTVRVSGQRHSQPPLVANDNRGAVPPLPTTYLVDMSCYSDLGPDLMVLGPGPNQITVNPGAKEDDVDAFLTKNNLMLETVTAGGFFSIGGMTAVDVHGGTVQAPIFADTASAFTILGADGSETVIDEQSKDGDGNSLLAFARVSLGALGIVTRITLNVLPRPYANTLKGGTEWYRLATRPDFVARLKALLTGPSKHTRMETFFTPYATPWPGQSNFLVLWWDDVANPNPPIANSTVNPQSACELSRAGEFGAPSIGIGKWTEDFIESTQTFNAYWTGAAEIALAALNQIESQAKTANLAYSDLWLAKSTRVMFMSYFIELPGLDDAGLEKLWDSLDVVSAYVLHDGTFDPNPNDHFHIAAPMEFRFIKGGNSAMAGTFTKNGGSYFVNLDLIGFVPATISSDYSPALLKFFAHVERTWVSMGGLPHNGKMYGFYDPTNSDQSSFTPPFNKNFLSFITRQRIETRRAPVDAFKTYRKTCDPNGLFYTQYLQDLLDG